MVGWWKFDGNAKDSSGYEHDGEEYGDPSYVSGKFGRAIRYDGDVDHIQVPVTVADDPELYAAEAISVSAWIKTATAVTDKSVTIIRHQGHFIPLMVGRPDRARAVVFKDEGNPKKDEVLAFDYRNINDGHWHHYAATYYRGTHKVWIDGININAKKRKTIYT